MAASSDTDSKAPLIFLAHAEAEKPFVERVKDAIVTLGRSRRVRVAAGPGAPAPIPDVFYDKDDFSADRDGALTLFTERAAAAHTFLLFVPAGGFHPRSFVGKEVLAFLAPAYQHADRAIPDPAALTADELALARRRLERVVLVDRHGELVWLDGGGAPTALPLICRDGCLGALFATERPRLREHSADAADVAAAALASVWRTTPDRVRSRVAARRRRIWMIASSAGAVVAALLVAAALVVALFSNRAADAKQAETDELRRRLAAATEQATAVAADALGSNDNLRAADALLQILAQAQPDDPLRAAAMAAFVNRLELLPEVIGNIGPLVAADLSDDGKFLVVQRADGHLDTYRVGPPLAPAPTPEVPRTPSLRDAVSLSGGGSSVRTSPDGALAAAIVPEEDADGLDESQHLVVWRLADGAKLLDAADIGDVGPIAGAIDVAELGLEPKTIGGAADIGWTDGPTLLVLSADAAPGSSALRGWRFTAGALVDRAPFVVRTAGILALAKPDRGHVLLPAATTVVGPTPTPRWIAISTLATATDYGGQPPAKLAVPCAVARCADPQNHFSSRPPWRVVSGDPTAAAAAAAAADDGGVTAMTSWFFRRNGFTRWYQGANIDHFVDVGSEGLAEADVERAIISLGRSLPTATRELGAATDRSTAIGVTATGDVFRMPLRLATPSSTREPVRFESSSDWEVSGRRLSRVVDNTYQARNGTRITVCGDEHPDEVIVSRDERLVLLDTPDAVVVRDRTPACRLLARLVLLPDDYYGREVVALLFQSADALRAGSATDHGELFARVGDTEWRMTAPAGALSATSGSRRYVLPHLAQDEQIEALSPDGRYLLVKRVTQLDPVACLQVFYLGAVQAIPLLEARCYDNTRVRARLDRDELVVDNDGDQRYRFSLGPHESAPWTWATPENFTWLLSPSDDAHELARQRAALREKLHQAVGEGDAEAAKVDAWMATLLPAGPIAK